MDHEISDQELPTESLLAAFRQAESDAALAEADIRRALRKRDDAHEAMRQTGLLLVRRGYVLNLPIVIR